MEVDIFCGTAHLHIELPRNEVVVYIGVMAVGMLKILKRPLNRVSKVNSHGTRYVCDVNLTSLGGVHGSLDNLVLVRTNREVKVRVQVGTRIFTLAHNDVLPLNFPEVTPHGKVLDQHLKVVAVMDTFLELLHIGGR